MKLTTFFLLISLASVASTGYSQSEKVTVQMQNARIKDLFKTIEQQTSYKFLYRDDAVENIQVNINEADKQLDDVLTQVLDGSDFSFKVMPNNLIVIAPESILQQLIISGTITDENQKPMPGVNILIEGTTIGAISDMNGKYSINIPSGDAVLVFSFIGYESQIVKVDNKAVINIKLNPILSALDEVVVIGYGTVRKADAAGSISVLGDKTYRDQPVIKISDAFQGRVTGMQISNSGVPGGDIKIRIRGASSINRSNDPLYVVDGMVRESGLLGINPDDIESIQVLKDASSTAIYGSRGSNGVVLITSKSGIANQRVITFDSQVISTDVYKEYDMLNANEFAQAYIAVKGFNPFTPEELTGYQNGTKGLNWQDIVFRPGLTQNYKLAMSDGNNKLQYYFSGNYVSDKGIVESSDYDRYQLRANVTSTLSERFKVTSDLNLSHNIRNGNLYKDKNLIYNALNYSPTMELINSNGYYNQDPYCSIAENPYGVLVENEYKRVQNLVTGMVEFKFTIIPSLTFVSTNGFDYNDSKDYTFISKKVATDLTSRASNSDISSTLLQSSNNLTFSEKWGDHSITATGVFEVSKSKTTYLNLSGSNLLTESVGYWNMNLATAITGSNSISEWALVSGVGRLMYNFQDRFNLVGTFRADGSSKFTNNKWGYFPSVALAWNLGNEEFMRGQSLFQNLKIRSSYGTVGNQAIGAYETLGLLAQTLFNYGADTQYTGYFAQSLPTPDLSWEKTKQFDIGLDFSMINKRIDFSLDYFNKQTVDGLLKKSIPSYLGGGSYWVNSGEISNIGFELALTGRVIQQKDLSFTTILNATTIKNEVISLAGDAFLYGSGIMGNIIPEATIIKPGYPIGSFYGYEWSGIDDQGKNTYSDLNGNEIFDSGDRRVIGDSNPKFIMGWNNMVTWKNWDFNIFLNGVFGQDILNINKFSMCSLHGESRFVTLREGYYDSFDNNPTNPKYASLKIGAVNPQGASTKWIEDGGYLRMENLSISYTIPKSMARFANIRITAGAQNLFTLTNYSGMDPSVFTFTDNVDVNNGFDNGVVPTPRSYSLGIKLDF